VKTIASRRTGSRPESGLQACRSPTGNKNYQRGNAWTTFHIARVEHGPGIIESPENGEALVIQPASPNR